MKEIVKALFSTHPNRTNTVDERGSTKECPFFTVKELDKGQKNARTVWYSQRNAETAKYKLELLLSAFNACLIAGIFPSRWKGAMLVIISKGQSHPRGAVSVLYSRCVKHSTETA